GVGSPATVPAPLRHGVLRDSACGARALRLSRDPVAFPKIIHQTWKDEQVPASLAPYQESWKRLHPEWEYRLWTDADNDALVEKEFSSLLDLYRSLPRAIHRADFARVLYLWRFGGLYVDLDIAALRPADELLDGHHCMLGTEPKLHAERLRGVDQVVCNAAMASEPNHPFWEKMIAEIRERSTQGREDPVWMTGPLCLQAAYEAHGEELGVELWDPDVFFPLPDLGSSSLPLSRSERRHYERMVTSGCYPRKSVGVHHWAHTWIPMNPLRQNVRKVMKVFRGATSVLRGQVTADELSRPDRYGIDFPEDRFLPRKSRQAEYLETRDAGRDASARSTLAIGVLIHNRIDLARLLRARLEALAGLFREARIYVIGEDSTDGTEEVLRDWARESPELVRCVAPVTTSQRGVARIAALRNALIEAIEAEAPTDFIAMVDGDLEGPISLDGVAHTVAVLEGDSELSAVAAFGLNNWVGLDATLPFLGYSYYDPLAFRERRWERTASDAAIRWRLRDVRRGDPLIPVKSAFAGCAIYRPSAIRGLRYELDGKDCEHVGFHRALADRGGRLGINPAMLLLAGKQGHHQAFRAPGSLGEV
ncbi:MAG: glycosyltransferase, partial [Deltaproteobacteria bacterium]